MTRAHSLSDECLDANGVLMVKSSLGKFLDTFSILIQRHAWKADFNQCTGQQLIAALNRALCKYGGLNSHLPFVLIGHSKQFNRANERSLVPFLEYADSDPKRIRFGIFQDVITTDASRNR